MSMQSDLKRVNRVPWDATMALAGTLALGFVLVASGAFGSEVGESLTRNTIRFSLAWYAASLLQLMGLRASDWNARTIPGRIARWSWTWGAIGFVIHVAMAFHYFHQWSHRHAFEHTRDVSGFGEGLYVSYAFTGVWIGDALWWWFWPARYATRSRWFDRTLHVFMLFIIFNGTVVFETGPTRWLGLLVFALIFGVWIRSLTRS